MTDLTALVQQQVSRYRRALLTNAVLVGAMGLGILAAAAWRLAALRVPPAWRIGLLLCSAVAGALALGWWLRRRWVPIHAGAAHLDQAFGLQQRLVTASEFAAAGAGRPLYPVLVEDTAARLSGQSLHLPKPLDRTTIALAVLLLLLLAWPLDGSSPLQQLARLPQPTPLTELGTPPPSQESQSSSSPQPQSSGAEQQQSSGGESSSGGSQPDARPQDQQAQQGGQPSDGAGGSDASQQPGRHPFDSAQDGVPSNVEGRQADAGNAPGQQNQGQQQAGDQQQTSGSQQQADGGRQAKGSQGDSQTQGQSQQRQAGSAKPSGGQGQQPAPADRSSQPWQAQADAAAGSAGRGAGHSAQSEALKAEIQQLLKEVSGELQELQAQVAQASSQHQPAAGTGTDPELFEKPTALDPARGETLPIQLSTDQAPTASPRPGAGVGRPSGEASDAAPQAVPEDAQLSDAPAEEDAAARQVVPPEYRSVFDRLQRHPAPPREPE